MVHVLKTHQDLVDLMDVNKKLVRAFKETSFGYEKKSPFLIDQLFRQNCKRVGIQPSTLGYGGFPGSLCVCVNDCVAHGVPSSRRKFQGGDIVTLDATGYNGRFHSDMAETYVLPGGSSDTADLKHLSKVTKDALDAAIRLCKPGTAYCDLSDVIYKTAKDGGLYVVDNLRGHGIGEEIHMKPYIDNSPCGMQQKFKKQRMQVGEVFSLEPIFALGTSETIKKRGDPFSIYTKDGSASAHFERNVAIVEGGCIILNDLDD